MYDVFFYDKKDVLLVQYRKAVPGEGESVTIKGRKGIVTRVNNVTDRKIHVHLELEPEKKNNVGLDPAKKKKR